MSEVVTILIDQIDARHRLRPVSSTHVGAMMASIERASEAGVGHGGLREPIEVCPLEGGIDAEGRGYRLVAGAHRLEAVRRLGRDNIAAVEYDIGTLEAQLLEVEENLIRADLNALDRAMFARRFTDLYEANYGPRHGGDRKSDQVDNVSSWSERAAITLGVGAKSMQRALRIANGLHDDAVRALRDTDWMLNHGTDWTDNQKALLELVGVPVEQQAEVVAILANTPAFSMRDAIGKAAGAEPPVQSDKDEQWFRKSIMIFTAHKRLRRRFFAEALMSDFDVLREAAEENGFTLEATKGWKG